MNEQPSSKSYSAQWESHDKDFLLLTSEDLWPSQMKPPAWAINQQGPSMFHKPQSSLIIKNLNEYVEVQSQYGKRNQQEWHKHENKYTEDKSALLAAPLTPRISRMSCLVSGKKSDCSGPSQDKSADRDWTNFESFGHSRFTQREIEARVSQDDSNIGDSYDPDIPFNYHPSDYAKEGRIQTNSLFERIKFYCLENPMVMKKVAEWSKNHAVSNKMTGEEIRELSRGRYWVTASSASPHGKSFKEDLDDLQGGYQEVDEGVFQRLIPQGREEAIQHRLFKYNFDRWAIDKWEVGVWRPVARETRDRSWVDLRYNNAIRVKVIPLLMILRRLWWEFHAHQKIDKCVEFLFSSFDRKKLTGKLKSRNLKHNIANLKSKLEKQYALNFAINVAATADCISVEDQKYHNSGGEFEMLDTYPEISLERLVMK